MAIIKSENRLNLRRCLPLLFLFLFFIPFGLFSEDKEDKKSSEEEKIEEIQKIVKDFNEIDGFIKMYQNPKNSVLYFNIEENFLGKEFIYFAHVSDGVVAARRNRGSYLDNAVFKFEKHFDGIRLLRVNTSFSFDPNSRLSKSKGANISDSVIKVIPIQAENNEGNEFLINVTGLFLSESLTTIKPIKNPEDKEDEFQWGQLSAEKSRIKSINNYPRNTDIEIEHVLENPPTREYDGEDVADPRNISISIRYSFIEMPSNNFNPRYEDQRIGYFTTRVTDLTSSDITPYSDLIHKWNLVKKHPQQEISEPVKPITFWIENTTPENLIPYIKEGALAWNEAFEKAGFKNAIEIKEQPENSEWDAGDIRYNVIRWTSSPNPPFGGYGPSFVNPRTGEIIGADIMLEWVYVTNRLNTNRIFPPSNPKDPKFCMDGLNMQENNILGNLINTSEELTQHPKILKQSVVRLTLHEIGHTLGLNHNFKASFLNDAVSIHNTSVTNENGVTSSVMEYPAINLAPIGVNQGDYYDTSPGPYDNWAIEFGYTPNLSPEQRNLLLSRSSEPQLMFGNDADDMRYPGKGIDPRAMVNDLSNQPIKYAIQRIKLVNKTMDDLPEILKDKASSWEEYRNAYQILTKEIGRSLEVISRYIGGVYVNRSTPSQNSNLTPLEPTPYETQKEAMEALSEYAFSPRAFPVSNKVLNLLQKERRGFDLYEEHEDPQIHRIILSFQGRILSHLLDGWVLYRLSDTRLYGNTYSVNEVLSDLTEAIFMEDSNSSITSVRQNLQTFYVRRLLKILSLEYYDEISSAAAYNSLRKIEKIVNRKGRDLETESHRQFIAWIIKSRLDKNR